MKEIIWTVIFERCFIWSQRYISTKIFTLVEIEFYIFSVSNYFYDAVEQITTKLKNSDSMEFDSE